MNGDGVRDLGSLVLNTGRRGSPSWLSFSLSDLDRIGRHHTKKDPGLFGDLIAGFDLSQAVVVFIIAIAAFQNRCPNSPNGFPCLIFLLAQRSISRTPAFGFETGCNLILGAVSTINIVGVDIIGAQLTQFAKMPAVKGNALF